MLNLDDCTRFHSDTAIIASHYISHLARCYIVTQESLKILDGITHAEISNFIFPFNGVLSSNLEQHKSLTISPSTVSGRIINAHFYVTSLSVNLVLVFSPGWICHISNHVLVHIENLQENLSASTIFSCKNEYLLTVCSAKSIYILTLESLSQRTHLSIPAVTLSNRLGSRQDIDTDEHSYPVEVIISWPLQIILYSTGCCSLYKLQDLDKHSLGLNLVFLGLLDLLRIDSTETRYVTSLSNFSIVDCTHATTSSGEIVLKFAYIYYLESSVRVDTMDLSASIRSLTESGFSSKIRAMRIEFPSLPTPSVTAQFYNISVTSPLSQLFLTSSANTLPTKVLSLYATEHHLVLHLMDDSVAVYSITNVDTEARVVSLADAEAFQPIHRHMRSRLASRTYSPSEVEFIIDNDATFDRHIVLECRIKQLINRSRTNNTIVRNRVPFLAKSLGHAGTIMGVDDLAGHISSVETAPTLSQIKFKPEEKSRDMLVITYSSTVFFLPVTFLTIQGTPGLPTNFLPEILITYSMARFGCMGEDPKTDYLKEKLDIYSNNVKEILASNNTSSIHSSIQIIPHPLLLPTQNLRDRKKYLSIAQAIFPEQAFFLEQVARMVNDPFYLDNADYLVCMGSLLAIFNSFRAEQRTLELRSYDAGLKSVMAAICTTFPPVAVIKNRFIILPQRTKITAGYGFSTKRPKTNSFTVMLPAWDLLQHTVLSAKIFPLTLSGKQFLRVYRQLSHRGILSFVGCGTAINNAFYILTEAPPKVKLSHVFRYDGEALQLFRSERRIKIFIRSLLQAINFLYSNDTKLIHRDLRPNQIWIKKNSNGDPVAKIYHMGFMCPLSANEPMEYNTIWVAPEVVCGGIDIKSDVWSVGTIAFRLLEILVNLHQGQCGHSLNNLFCPSFADISKVPSFAPGSGERSLLVANNASVIYQMMLMSSDKIEVAPKRYAVYTVKNCDIAIEKAKVPWSMRRAYFASTGILPWHDLNYAKPGAQKEECGNLDTFFETAIYSQIISADAVDFVKRCWTFNLDLRLSPELMLTHPWLVSRSKQLSVQN
ncbi:Kinase [Giardia lamblia P15]|uniref:Kinase n=1 Tax=Giardia intestinalis (strain P15) TaxID=658858 RepID=E1EVP7_GIAIA|nr:Kinase [Giardia lamblia P15]